MPFKRQKQYRLPGYDYASEGAYFITICTANRQGHFGHIDEHGVHYSLLGQAVVDNLIKLEGRLPHLQLDEWEVMPDHLHLIVTLHPLEDTERDVDDSERAAAGRVPTVDSEIGVHGPCLRPLVPGSVASFINHLKGRITRYARLHQLYDFRWQPRFHDRIIRDHREYISIVAYVQRNIEAWQEVYNNITSFPSSP